MMSRSGRPGIEAILQQVLRVDIRIGSRAAVTIPFYNVRSPAGNRRGGKYCRKQMQHL